MKSKNTRRGHWDALGSPILDFYGMMNYYAADERSTAVLRGFLPHSYVVKPAYEIRFRTNDPRAWNFSKVYPGGSVSRLVIVGKRALSWARLIYVSKNASWKVDVKGGYVTLRKQGQVIPLEKFKNSDQ